MTTAYVQLTAANWVEMRYLVSCARACGYPNSHEHRRYTERELNRCFTWVADNPGVFDVPEKPYDFEVQARWCARMCKRLGHSNVMRMLERLDNEYKAARGEAK